MGASGSRQNGWPWLETPGWQAAECDRPAAAGDGDLMRDASLANQTDELLERLAGRELHNHTSRMMADGAWPEADSGGKEERWKLEWKLRLRHATCLCPHGLNLG